MKITIQIGSYKIVATRQAKRKVWLVHEYTEPQETAINTYATTWKGLLRTLNSVRKETLNIRK